MSDEIIPHKYQAKNMQEIKLNLNFSHYVNAKQV